MAHPLHPLAGVGLRTPHLDYFSHNSNKVDWLEIHSENYFSPHAKATEQLRAIRQDHEISCHGVGLSLGFCGTYQSGALVPAQTPN